MKKQSKLALISLTFSILVGLSSQSNSQACTNCESSSISSNVVAQTRPAPVISTNEIPARVTQNEIPIKVTQNQMMLDQEQSTMTNCCPLIMSGPFTSYFQYHQLPGKNISQSYGLKFLSTFVYGSTPETVPQTLALDKQMMPYALYAGSLGSGLGTSGWNPNSVILTGEMRPVVAPTVAAYNAAASASFGKHALRGWWAGGFPPSTNPYNVWNGSTGTEFNKAFQDGNTPLATHPPHMTPNGQWYMIKMHLEYAEMRGPGTWQVKEIVCNNYKARYVAIRINAQGFKIAGGGTTSGTTQVTPEIIEVR